MAIMIAALLSGSAKPANVVLVTIPAGGTRPMREPGGNTGSAARAGSARATSTRKAATPPEARTRARFLFMVQNLCGRMELWRDGCGARDPTHREIDPSALREQGRGARVNPIDAVESEPRIAAENERVSRAKPEGTGAIAPLCAANPEQAGIAE